MAGPHVRAQHDRSRAAIEGSRNDAHVALGGAFAQCLLGGRVPGIEELAAAASAIVSYVYGCLFIAVQIVPRGE